MKHLKNYEDFNEEAKFLGMRVPFTTDWDNDEEVADKLLKHNEKLLQEKGYKKDGSGNWTKQNSSGKTVNAQKWLYDKNDEDFTKAVQAAKKYKTFNLKLNYAIGEFLPSHIKSALDRPGEQIKAVKARQKAKESGGGKLSRFQSI